MRKNRFYNFIWPCQFLGIICTVVKFTSTVYLNCLLISRRNSTIDLLTMIDSLKTIVTVILPVCAKEEILQRSRDMSTMIYADTELSIHYNVL